MGRRPATALVLLLVAFNAFFLASGVLTSGRAVTTTPAAAATSGNGRKVYIVFTERQQPPVVASEKTVMAESAVSERIEAFHHGLLAGALEDDTSSTAAAERVVYHYTRSLHGFAARLTEQEKNNLAAMDGVVSIHEKVVYRPQTTRSWNFLGLPQQSDAAAERLPFEKDVIIGMVDTGVWPESESFADDGLPPPPAKWKGVCSKNFTACNNKIIGARAYKDGDTNLSPLDEEGHGTHTASTAAGRPVRGASMGGLAAGTARSAVPGARLAIYKVCWFDGCSSDDILAAFDDAIADGVDVLSASIGTSFALDYADDTMAVGAFHAMRRGIVTSTAAGNDGPYLGSVSNVAPWVLSVAASSTDRKIVSNIVLGNGRKIVGSAITVFPDLGKRSVLIDPGTCGLDLQGKSYKGAILLCGQSVSEDMVHAAGADGAITFKDETDTAFVFAVPAVVVTEPQYHEILHYYNTSRLPMASVLNSQTTFDEAAPTVAAFSSRGPNLITHAILKPDISAPGVDILAAWPGNMSVSGSTVDVDDRQMSYNIISGTSMACPHVSGVAAYVKSVHPDWSPAAVISSLVTTATPMSASATPEAELAYGAGQLNPVRAVYPGLVYDASERDYLSFLCAQGHNATQIAAMTDGGATFVCPEDRGSVASLNYPSIAVPVVNYGVRFAVEVPRTVTNVGPPDSVYRVNVTSVPRITVSVMPRELAFSSSEKTKKKSFTVRVSGSLAPVSGALGASASMVWSDGRHHVRSPIYVYPLSATRS